MYKVIPFDDKAHNMIYSNVIQDDGETINRLYVVRNPNNCEIEITKVYESGHERNMSIWLNEDAIRELVVCLNAQLERIEYNKPENQKARAEARIDARMPECIKNDIRSE